MPEPSQNTVAKALQRLKEAVKATRQGSPKLEGALKVANMFYNPTGAMVDTGLDLAKVGGYAASHPPGGNSSITAPKPEYVPMDAKPQGPVPPIHPSSQQGFINPELIRTLGSPVSQIGIASHKLGTAIAPHVQPQAQQVAQAVENLRAKTRDTWAPPIPGLAGNPDPNIPALQQYLEQHVFGPQRAKIQEQRSQEQDQLETIELD